MIQFQTATGVQKIQRGIQLFNAKGKEVESLEVGSHHLNFIRTDLFISSTTAWDFFEKDPPSLPKNVHAVHGSLTASDNFYTFKGSEFFGQIKKMSFHCTQADENRLLARPWPPDAGVEPEAAFHITCHLTHDLFKETFHPIWVRQSKSVLQISLEATAYQFGPEGAFREPFDIQNLVIEAGADINARLVSISLVTPIQDGAKLSFLDERK